MVGVAWRLAPALAAAISLTIAATPAAADTYCGGDASVTRILTYQDGGVLVLTSWRGDFVQICNLAATWKGVPPATCFAWMSQIAAAISAGKATGFWYGGAQTCATIPTYGNAGPPVYIDTAR